MGARGVKLWISLKDEHTGAMDRTRRMLQQLRGADLPVLIHTFHRTDDNLPGEVTVAEFADLARSVPDINMIAAHSGCNWRQALGLLAGIDNAFVDICGGYPETGMVEALTRDVGAQHVLYGSDALGRSFPSQLAKVTFASIGQSEREAILWRNAAGLLKLDETELERVSARAEVPTRSKMPLPDLSTDHFCFFGKPPFRDSPAATVAELEERLAANNIEKAYVADAATLYASDPLAANRRFAEQASGAERLVPLATLLPYVPNRDSLLREARSAFRGGILFPYFHNWQLDDSAYAEFFRACSEAQFPLWVNVCTADVRFRHRGTVCRSVARGELLHFIEAAPPNRYVFQGVGGTDVAACLGAFPGRSDISFEISRLTDNTNALPDVIDEHGSDRLVFGTEFPFRDLRTVARTAARLCGWSTHRRPGGTSNGEG